MTGKSTSDRGSPFRDRADKTVVAAGKWQANKYNKNQPRTIMIGIVSVGAWGTHRISFVSYFTSLSESLKGFQGCISYVIKITSLVKALEKSPWKSLVRGLCTCPLAA